MKKQTLFLSAAIILQIFLLTTVNATVRTFQFTGTITSGGTGTYVATLSYDDSQSPTYTTTGTTDYANYTFTLVINGTTTYYRDPGSTIRVYNDQPYGDYFVTNGTGTGRAGFSLGDASGTVFNSTALPSTLTLSSFNQDVWVAVGGNPPIIGSIATITDLTPTGSYDIYTVSTKDGSIERITYIDDADEYNPSFNNNGKLVAHDVVSSSDPLGQSIYITDIKTHTSTPLAGAEGGNDASWSPDGKYIAFDRDGNIYVVPSSGGTATLVRKNAMDAEWSNNSKRLVFTDITTPNFYPLMTIDVKSGSETNLGVQGINASWSPNGKSIAYSDYSNIFKIAVNEAGEAVGSAFQLTNSGSGEFSQQPSWANNGKTIVYHSNRVSGDVDIWTIASTGGTPYLLSGDPDNGDYDPCYSKNGKYVAYAGFTTNTNQLSKNIDNNNELIITKENFLPTEYSLDQNFPNPFNPTTQINYSIPKDGYVTLTIYDALGKEVSVLENGNKSAGSYSFTFDANNLASGMYFYTIRANNFIQTKKMLLMK